VSRRRVVVADVLGLAAIVLFLADYLRPSLLFLPTITAGGDTPCHYPTAVWLYEQLLPRAKLHGWYPGAYLGQPLLLYYFPLPFLVMSALAPAVGMPVAFKLGTALGVFLLPLCAYACFRLLGFRFPAPLLGAAATLVFLFLEENPIWGGTLPSTLTGEFSYTYGLGLALMFLGLSYRAYAQGRSPWLPALALALTALAHGYAVLWAGLSATYFLYGARRPQRALAWLAGLAAAAFALAGFWLLPLLWDWGWTTPYDDAWITVTARNLLPRLLWPLLGLAVATLLGTVVWWRRSGGPDRRLLFLGHAALVGAALTAAGPALGIIDVRFVPFAQLALCLLGAAGLARALQLLAAADLAALALVVLAGLYADAQSGLARYWVEWNYGGLEAKELWPDFRVLAERLRGTAADPRVAVEYSAQHEKAGSIRMYETLPLFSGRSTLEGVYNQASLQTHYVYYLASELGASSPNPFRSRSYSTFDTEAALRHLRLFHVSHVVALSATLRESLEARPEAERLERIGPYTIYRLREVGSYVEPLTHAPVRVAWRGWREKAWRWFTRKPLSPAHLVFTDDARFTVRAEDEWLAPPLVSLPGGTEVEVQELSPERIRFRTSRPGHPLLVKVSYHPRWRAQGARGPYLVSPALMMVVPTAPDVALTYARGPADVLGLLLTVGAAAVAAGGWMARRRRVVAEAAAPVGFVDACDLPPPTRRWGGAVPAALLGLLFASRLSARPPAGPDPVALFDLASRAYAEGRSGAAAEYARHALSGSPAPPLRAGLLCLRGESLLRAGEAVQAAAAFEALLEQDPGPYAAQALYGLTQAQEQRGDHSAAVATRARLLREHPGTPWADRARREEGATGGRSGPGGWDR
jgi:hypothetical protein